MVTRATATAAALEAHPLRADMKEGRHKLSGLAKALQSGQVEGGAVALGQKVFVRIDTLKVAED